MQILKQIALNKQSKQKKTKTNMHWKEGYAGEIRRLNNAFFAIVHFSY